MGGIKTLAVFGAGAVVGVYTFLLLSSYGAKLRENGMIQ